MSYFTPEKRIIAFIDILGFKELFKSKDKQSLLLEILYEISRANSSYRVDIDGNSLQIHPDISSYSDNIIISAPILSQPIMPLMTTEMYFKVVLSFIVDRINSLQIFSLNKGIALRGAISYGDVHFDRENNIIAGLPIIEAIEDEVSLAKYPRIIASQGLLKHVIEYMNIPTHIFNKMFHNELFNFCLDVDGMYYLDFLKSAFLLHTPENISTLENIRNIIEDNLITLSDNLNIVSKWNWLANYFDRCIDIVLQADKKFSIKKFDLLEKNFTLKTLN